MSRTTHDPLGFDIAVDDPTCAAAEAWEANVADGPRAKAREAKVRELMLALAARPDAATVVSLHFGFADGHALTVGEIAEELNRTVEDVQATLNRGLGYLREAAQAARPDRRRRRR